MRRLIVIVGICDSVIPFFDSHEVKLILIDRGSEYCGNPERHEYELYLAVEDVDQTSAKTKAPRRMGFCEGFHKTVLNEFYRVPFRKKVLPVAGPAADRSRFLNCRIQRGAAASRTLVLRKNSKCHADDQGEDDRSLTRSDTKTRSLNQAPAVRSSSG